MVKSHRIRGRRVLGLLLIAGALIVGGFVVPLSWLEGLTGLFGTSREEAGAFSAEAAALDQALDADETVVLATTQIGELAPHVGVRRALRAGPMTSEEVTHATRILSRAIERLDGSKTEADASSVLNEANEELLEACPRLDPVVLSSELQNLKRQLERVRPQPGASPPVEDSCASCHAQTQPLPSDRGFDASGIYPHMGEHEAFANGRNIPVLVESLELQALPQPDEAADCLTCHVPHGAAGFEIDRAERVENQGLWVNILPTEPGVMHVQVKSKNHNGGHRVPAGRPKSAYVVTVQGFQGSTRLPLRYGAKLPTHLRTAEFEAGAVFARHMVDSGGAVTTDLDEVVDLQFDSRLAPGRFAEDHFVFDRAATVPGRTVVTLWYLPDYATWENATVIRRADKPEAFHELARESVTSTP